MAVEVVLPKFGLTMLQGTIQQWFKAEGDPVAAGEPLFEVETEKVLYEIDSPASGIVARLLYPAESTVPVATVVAVIAEEGENPAEVAARYEALQPRPTSAAPASPPQPREAAPPPERGGGAPRVTPVARKLAKQHGIDLATLAGTGPGGRITREDVEAAIALGAQEAAAGTPLRGMRKVIAARMQQSLQATAQLTITSEADVTAMVQRRQKLQEQFPLTYTDLLVEATAKALRQHAQLNAAAEGEMVQLRPDVHIGIAVALDEGLIVPVIRHADRKSLREIAAEASELAEKARAGSLTVDDVSGGTFTITNLGMYGVDAFTPILHLPQAAILGAGRVQEKPAVYDGAITKRHLMTLSLTFDHRIVDGAPAAAFLQTVIHHLSARESES